MLAAVGKAISIPQNKALKAKNHRPHFGPLELGLKARATVAHGSNLLLLLLRPRAEYTQKSYEYARLEHISVLAATT